MFYEDNIITHVIFRWSSIPGRIRIWRCWFLWREENQRINNKLNSHDGKSGNITRVTVVRGERSHSYTIHASHSHLLQY
jgi:hypothetical protein